MWILSGDFHSGGLGKDLAIRYGVELRKHQNIPMTIDYLLLPPDPGVSSLIPCNWTPKFCRLFMWVAYNIIKSYKFSIIKTNIILSLQLSLKLASAQKLQPNGLAGPRGGGALEVGKNVPD